MIPQMAARFCCDERVVGHHASITHSVGLDGFAERAFEVQFLGQIWDTRDNFRQ